MRTLLPNRQPKPSSLSRPSPVRSWGQNAVASMRHRVSAPLFAAIPARCVPIHFLELSMTVKTLVEWHASLRCKLDVGKWCVIGSRCRLRPRVHAHMALHWARLTRPACRGKLQTWGAAWVGLTTVSCAPAPTEALIAQWMVPVAPLGKKAPGTVALPPYTMASTCSSSG